MTKLITSVQNWAASKKADEEGATMVEYGVMVAFIAAACTLAVTALGVEVKDLFNSIKF